MPRKKIVLPLKTEEINWNQPNGKLALQFGVTICTIARIRREAGIKPLSRGKPKGSPGPRKKKVEADAPQMAAPVPVTTVPEPHPVEQVQTVESAQAAA